MTDGDGGGAFASAEDGARLTAKQALRSRAYVKFSAALARRILGRVALGEPLRVICAEAGMPSANTVTVWAKTRAPFGRALALAREAAAADDPANVGFCPDTAREIFARLCEGEPLYRICRDPRMPGKSTVYRWREREPDFDRSIRLARDICAETVCEESLETARAVTPQTAHAVRVRLEHERWFVRAVAPGRFGPVRPQDVDELDWAGGGGGSGGGMTVIVRKFTDPPESLEGLAAETKALYRGES
ncbi:hypothetical protein ACO2Q0_18075 [Phenylobacterium sp. VNQ135]|uniref:terminase small subunit-like protein n=1 Tax=Phenylobacterium sp. VNQ135 TaxID=3400922 RepID=UPI003C09A016